MASTGQGILEGSVTGIVGTGSEGLVFFITTTNAPLIEKLNGWSAQIGGSLSVVGVESVYFKDATTNAEYSGITYSVDLSSWLSGKIPTSAEGHLSASWSNVWVWDNVRN